MKKLKGNRALTLATMLSALVAYPGNALAQGICQTNLINNVATLDCVTSLSESASGSVGFTQFGLQMRVTFSGGQENAQGVILASNGSVHCLGPVVTSGTQSVGCLTGGSTFRITVN